ncbi:MULTISPECIES: IS607 family transposase [unclassified Caballeronia]|uniref:IS607 family transposase n=1 Tax=unclassified Caballeronia TaxID=2646786 RepID=UPI00025BC30D|nr:MULTISPECIES: IS607 family transposase [unclassified Caballeronia]EKS70222.1 transposon IS605 OrfA, integrase-resolvase [Burkholderia sp. SJ98]MCE4546514.1 IS607 family transposase [Caballeronia sp. PC1]MCE4573013.1 IS607 family transposase [Caballeronia sp. CLC5]
MQLLSIGKAAAHLGVAVGTLRRWHRRGQLAPAGRTPGGHRRYERGSILSSIGHTPESTGKTVCYARVSSHDQAEQLKTQAARLEQHCADAGFAEVGVITDLGSGLNYRKKGMQRLLFEILRGRVSRLVVVTKDRLLRFGSELLYRICEFFGVNVIILDAAPDVSREQQLTEDLVEILTVFSSRLYGSRSRKNLRALAS